MDKQVQGKHIRLSIIIYKIIFYPFCSMEGFTNDKERGIIPRATEDIFNYIQNCGNPKTKFLVRASYLQIYKEVVSDLLKPERTNLTIREDKKRGVYVEGLSEWVVRSPAEIYGLMERGAQVRATGSTKMNKLSSRSHAVFIIIAEQSETSYINENNEEIEFEDYKNLATKGQFNGEIRQSFRIGKLNLVDLAGSERVRFSGATGERLEESKKINQSLSMLGNVISALTDPKGRQHIPYRDSKLTRLLEDSLGGNCKTTMMAMVSPALEAFAESVSTLKFAHRAKNIKNEARINEDLDQRALLRKYERELKKLRAELEKKSKHVVDKQRLLELEEQKRRAEEDKLAAITALEKRSREFMHEKQAKRKLEERIAMMQSQLLVGGQKIEETAEFKNLVKRVHKEYEDKLAELEKERQSVEKEQAQLDRFKQLLVKQRDIMIALTGRLNERDETILALQEELDAYDRHQRMLEEAVDRKNGALLQLQKIAMEPNTPLKSVQISKIIGEVGTLSSDEISLRQSPQNYGDESNGESGRNQVFFGNGIPENQILGRVNNTDTYQQQDLENQYHQLQQDVLKLSEERKRLSLEVEQLQRTKTNEESQESDSSNESKQLLSFKQQCITKEKEKQALKTILETKVKVMVDSIYRSVDGLMTESNRDNLMQTKSVILALNQLVNASIAALSLSRQQA